MCVASNRVKFVYELQKHLDIRSGVIFFFLGNLALSEDLFRQESNFGSNINNFVNTSTYQVEAYILFF